MFKEEDMQIAVEKKPDIFFGEGVRLYEREASLGSTNRTEWYSGWVNGGITGM